MITERIGPTLILAGSSIVLSIAVSFTLGILAASRPGSKRDYFASGLSFLMLSTPNFFIGLALIFIFAAGLKILPSNGMYDSSGGKTILILLKHLILPTVVLSFQHIGSWIRYVRSSVMEVLQEDYIRTAKSKGLTRTQVLFRHGLKNALIPVVSVIGMSLPGLISGAVVTEQVFSWPGIGSLMVRSIALRDYPVIMGITVIVAAAVLVINLAVDLLYGFLDPRISYD
jgi:peptide/nickel transport system permease protein